MAADIDLTLLRSFAAVIRSGTISRAALLLGRTQPALSQHIQRLEEQLGHRLLVRTNVGVAPTPAGERLMAIAERLLGLADTIPAALGASRAPAKVRIGIAEEFVPPQRLEMLRDLELAYPGLKLNIVLAGKASIARMANEGSFDAALNDPGLHDEPPVETRTTRLSWLAAPGFDATRRPLPLVLWRAPCEWRSVIIRTVEEAGIAWTSGVEAESVAAMHAAARHGLGLTVTASGSPVPGLSWVDSMPELPPIHVGLFTRDCDERVSRFLLRMMS